MHDLHTIGTMNKEWEARELAAKKDYVRFTHEEVEYLREWFATVSNPTPLLRGIIRKFELIHELQVEAYSRKKKAGIER